jgi:hypothetical protein
MIRRGKAERSAVNNKGASGAGCSFAHWTIGVSPQVLEMRCLIGGSLLMRSDGLSAFDAPEIWLHSGLAHFESSLDF